MNLNNKDKIINKLEQEIKKDKIALLKLQRQRKLLNTNGRKKRVQRLMKIGGLLEIAKIGNAPGERQIEESILLGFFMSFNKLTESQKENFKINGMIELEIRRNEREKIKKDRSKVNV